ALREEPRERVRQRLHAVAEGCEEAVAGAADAAAGVARRTALSGGAEGADQAAVLLLHHAEAGQRRHDAELVRVGAVDAGDQWLGETLERLAAQAALDEVAEAFVLLAAAARDEQ